MLEDELPLFKYLTHDLGVGKSTGQQIPIFGIFSPPRLDFYHHYWASGGPEISQNSAVTGCELHGEIRIPQMGFVPLDAKYVLRAYTVLLFTTNKLIEDEVPSFIPWGFKLARVAILGVVNSAQ